MSLYVMKQGSGVPVVLLHSGGMSSRQWRKLSEQLSATHQALAPDLLGSGENPLWPNEAPFDFSVDVAAVAEVAEALSSPFHLVGHSYGGLIALFLAKQMPSMVLSLSLYDPVAFGVLYGANDPEGIEELEQVAALPVFLDRTLGGSEAWLEAFINYWNGPGSWGALPQTTKDAFLKVGRKVFYEVSSLMGDRTAASAYQAITSPALLFTGERSPVAAQHVAQILAASLPKGSLARIEGAGHMGPLTHINRVNRLILEHILKSERA